MVGKRGEPDEHFFMPERGNSITDRFCRIFWSGGLIAPRILFNVPRAGSGTLARYSSTFWFGTAFGAGFFPRFLHSSSPNLILVTPCLRRPVFVSAVREKIQPAGHF